MTDAADPDLQDAGTSATECRDQVERVSIGSLAGRLALPDEWDSPRTNAEIAADFGVSP